jgi:hypothetical protein
MQKKRRQVKGLEEKKNAAKDWKRRKQAKRTGKRDPAKGIRKRKEKLTDGGFCRTLSAG